MEWCARRAQSSGARARRNPVVRAQGAIHEMRAGRKPEVKRRIRLRRHGDFQAVMSGRRFFSGKTLVAFAIPNQQEANRVGVTVSRTLKSAVDRNRARRRLRELVRITLLGADSPLTGVGIRYDVVLIARPAALEVAFAELVAEAEQAALRLSKLKS